MCVSGVNLLTVCDSVTHSLTCSTLVFTATDYRENERKAMQVWTLKGDKAYLITYKAEPEKYSKYLPTIQKMIDSFEIIK